MTADRHYCRDEMRVLYFALCRELVGLSEEHIDLAEVCRDGGGTDSKGQGNVNTDDLKRFLTRKYPMLESLLETCALAINEEYAGSSNAALHDSDTVAIIPPISGG